MMTPMKRILPIALIAALLGGSVGAFVMRAPKSAETANTTTAATTPVQAQSNLAGNSGQANLTGEQAAFRDGFEEGFLAAQEKAGLTQSDYQTAVENRSSAPQRVVYQNNGRSRRVTRSGNNSRRVYYDYEQPQPKKRSFWSKHRDKLTVAAGTGGGALIGGLIGGKKGALIGGLAGAGGSALYTYKLRKRDRRQ
jgi:hypothetical protein